MISVKELYRRFIVSSIKDSEKVPDVGAWMEFLDKLPFPSDAVDLSYSKYRCRMWYMTKPKSLLINFASFFKLLLSVPNVLRSKQGLPDANNNKLVIIEMSDLGIDDILPSELIESYPSFSVVRQPKLSLGCLRDEPKALFRECVRRHPFKFYYLLLMLKELSLHSAILAAENPRVVAVYINERNAASPLLTKMYEDTDREFVSFMHGEYLLQLIQAYSSFSKFYVWDESYIDMFENDLRFQCGEYIVYTPKKLQKKWNLADRAPSHFCTFYLSGESTRSIRKLSSLCEALERRGLRSIVRPHPRHSHWREISLSFPVESIEDFSSVSLEESLAKAEYIVGLSSTVLYEALAEGKKVVIDNVSDVANFNNLKARRFTLLDRPVMLLSELLDELGVAVDEL